MARALRASTLAGAIVEDKAKEAVENSEIAHPAIATLKALKPEMETLNPI